MIFTQFFENLISDSFYDSINLFATQTFFSFAYISQKFQDLDEIEFLPFS